MQKFKTKKTIALSLILASAVAIGGAAIALGTTQNAYASDYTQELDGTKVFYTGIRGAEITYSPTEGEGEDTHVYTMFKVGEGETVEYRQNLAYSWRTSATDVVTFSMEIGFANTDFERYVIRFQSQQHALTKDNITENYIVFTPSATENVLDMSIVQELKDDTVLTPVASYPKDEHIKICFGNFNDGEYPIYVNGTYVESFKNVYEPFATYVSSGDKAVTPLTFSATFAEDASDEATANMVLYDINGQTFELLTSSEDEDGNVIYETKVIDNAAPVLCFTKTPSYLIDGDSIDFSYRVIDVIGTSTRATAYYYVLSGDQYAATDFDYDKTEYESEESDDNPFIEISSGSSIRIIRDENTFIPRDMLGEGVYGLVKIYYSIADRSGSTAQTDIVFVDWYAKDDALVDIKDIKGSGESSMFLKLIDENDHKPGLTYAQESNLSAADPTEAYKNSIKDFQTAYQQKINDAIAELKDDDGNVVGKLFAGTDSKFYLPSFDNLFDSNGELFDLAATDEYLNKGDYKFSIYYKAKTSGSATSLDINSLSISLSEADVNYRFTIYITDSFGNDMRYPTLVDGEIVWETISKNDVWDEDYAELLPFFEFHVSYKEATATPPETLSVAYVNTAYSGVSFSIKGISGTYTAKYNLYVVDRDGLNKELNEQLDYETFKDRIDELFNSPATRKYFTTVKPASSLVETDENYELFKELNWNATSVSFTPRSVNDFYVVRLALEDNNSKKTDYQYTAVAASVETTSLKGESDWIENNLTSVILFSVAGIFLIALVVLLVVKPKDKGDIDTVYSEEVEKKNAKKEKKKKS
ncbi:MAG: hypothetical protein ACI4QN_00550 [Candidatus Coproplasma sp.]